MFKGKPAVLYIMHMPPPFFGASIVGQRIKDSKDFNEAFHGTFINIALANSIEDMGSKPLSKITKYIRKIKEIKYTLSHKHFDLCYITPSSCGFAFLKDYFVIQMVKRKGIPVLIHFHNKGVSKYQQKLIYNFLYSRFFKSLKVILLSPILYNDIKKYVSESDVFYSYVGIPDNNQISCKVKGGVQFAFVSILLKSKGVLELIDACEILKKKGYSFRCVIAGRESIEINRNMLDLYIVNKDLSDVVEYIGVVDENEKDKLFAESHAFVFPTSFKSECFPAAILEAMRNRTAVISTNEGAIPDEIDEGATGFIVQKNDVLSLAKKMEYVIRNPEVIETMGINGRLKFEQQFTIDIFNKKLIDIFNKCISHDKSRT